MLRKGSCDEEALRGQRSRGWPNEEGARVGRNASDEMWVTGGVSESEIVSVVFRERERMGMGEGAEGEWPAMGEGSIGAGGRIVNVGRGILQWLPRL